MPSGSGTAFASERSGYLYFGIPGSDDPNMSCKYALPGSNTFTDFPSISLGETYTYNPSTGYLECPKYPNPLFRTSAGAIIQIIANGKTILTTAAAALATGGYIPQASKSLKYNIDRVNFRLALILGQVIFSI